MSEVEVAQLLTRIQTIDGRTTDRLTLEAWMPIVEHIRYDDAIRAVAEHYAGSGDYLMPHHIVTLTRKYEEDRQREMRRMMEGGQDKPGVPKPPYFDAMERAAQAAAAAERRRRGHSNKTIERAAFQAAEAVQHEWEAVHGEWNKVGHTWYDEHPDEEQPF